MKKKKIQTFKCPNIKCNSNLVVRVLDTSIVRPEFSELTDEQWLKAKNKRHEQIALTEPDKSKLIFVCPNCCCGLNGHSMDEVHE